MQTPAIVRRIGYTKFATIPNNERPKFIKIIDNGKLAIIKTNANL
ncbi:hypothetical protein [Synechococcus phage S-M1]|uniref:Uncharacterized protein n=1 Tax=Synechococcus phage QB2 TaxID=3159453 RepID=A0AAU8EK04_9CAUD|nr:hypothetical protein [Synechococcus phage S-M1]